MNFKAQAIRNRLSLRKPQADSLEILQKITDIIKLKKDNDPEPVLEQIKSLYPTCQDFERDFPSICFSLATGVGKTRLMGAFIAYLHNAKGITNFFVLAPNLTIYNKLIDDLSKPNNPKYVFRGISEFAVNAPKIITGDNYEELAGQSSLFKSSVNINIFNISKINSEVRGGREPRIKRLSEYIGESYFNYLASLPDLVLLMDESHHYRADSGLKAINDLKPILGLELTATPIDDRGNKFKNVVFDYPLALALQDRFVKEPAIATRKDFNPDQYRNDPKELDLIKLEDGIRLHEDTKVGLEIYARDTKSRLVRPFVLVVARDTDHAKEISDLIKSDKFFGGQYHDKVMEIHSNQRGEEKEENVQRLLELEQSNNKIEIVIHVNMLKEGWDVTNLYTIIPLRAANSQILTEQTIGRGLRLPYGIRTGNKKVDTLTIIAHDSFQNIVDTANSPDSIIRKENIIEIDPSELSDVQELVISPTVMEEEFSHRQNEIDKLSDNNERHDATISLEAEKLVLRSVNELGSSIKSINDLSSPEASKLVMEQLTQHIIDAPQQNLFRDEIIAEAKKEYQSFVAEIIKKIIPIPRVIVAQKNETVSGFKDFSLDIKGLNYLPVSEDIVRHTLRTNENEVMETEGIGVVRDSNLNIVVNELINYPEVEYDRESDLLYKLANQAVSKITGQYDEATAKNIILYHKREIGKFIYAQLQDHFFVEEAGFEEPIIYPFTKIESHNLSRYSKDSVHHYCETITPTNSIPSKVFGGFKKACHNLYKFDSKSEKDFASILESDKSVLKWLRPAQAQFQIYWKHNSKRYIPDFVVETSDIIYLVEIKSEADIDDSDVKEKAKAGVKYCETVSDFNQKNGGKKWSYVLIPHNTVAANMSFESLVERYVFVKNEETQS